MKPARWLVFVALSVTCHLALLVWLPVPAPMPTGEIHTRRMLEIQIDMGGSARVKEDAEKPHASPILSQGPPKGVGDALDKAANEQEKPPDTGGSATESQPIDTSIPETPRQLLSVGRQSTENEQTD